MAHSDPAGGGPSALAERSGIAVAEAPGPRVDAPTPAIDGDVGHGDVPETSWQRSRGKRVDDFVEFTSGPKVRVQEGLNGVRGLAVIPVVAFHLGYHQLFGGAQLVMSLFFTQSGFLIATLILHEYGRTGRFELGPFWATRARRILPPAWMTIAGVGVVRLTTKAFDNPDRLDMLTAFGHASNWYLYFSDAIRDAIVGHRSSELNPTWSLSIEEQFYVVIALLAVVLVVMVTRPLIWLRWVAIGGAAISFALPFVFRMNDERVFYGTDTRAGELLTGVALATFMIYRDVRVWLLRVIWWLGGISSAALLTAFVLWHEATPKSRMLENGLLPAGSVLWVLVILGAMVPDGPVTWLAHGRLLRWLGMLSYGIYIYHFPVLRFVDYYVDAHPIVISLIVVPATLAISVLSHRFVEMPIRRQQIRGRKLAVGAATAFGVIALTTALT